MGNKVIGKVGPKLGIYEESNDAQLSASLGQERVMDDGRKFRLCSNGEAALAAGFRLQSVAVDTYDDALVVNAVAAVGDKEIEVTTTSSHSGHAANLLKDGYLVVNQGTGCIGTFYKIKANDLMSTGVTATIELYDALTYAIAIDDEVSICLNPYKGVILDVLTAPIAGVPLIAVTASTSTVTYYFWALFKGFGPAIVANGQTATSGFPVERLTGGEVKTLATGATIIPIGNSYSVGAADDAIICEYF